MEAMKTPIYESHVKHGGRIVDFAGWKLPVDFKGLKQEHLEVRNNVGIFDVSHMGEFIVEGEKATEFVQKIIANDVKKLYEGKIIYTPMCYETGGIVDDLLVYKYSDKKYLLVVNAANIEKDFKWLNDNNTEGVSLKNVSDKYFQLAVQGPRSKEVMEKCFNLDLSDIKFFHFKEINLDEETCIVSRTGYTGENGFEIYGEKSGAKIFDKLVSFGVIPCGLGCRDTLRLEAALMLYGNDITKDTTPLEATIGMFVSLDGGDFIGKSVLVDQKQNGVKKKLIGFKLNDRAIPRHGYKIFDKEGNEVGIVTSGTLSPSLNIPIGLCYVKKELINNELFVEVRNKKFPIERVKLPFLKKY
jgi:aminomethyltransferase